MTNTVFMIHGEFSGPWSWEKYLSFFNERGFRCMACTLRYHDMDPTDNPNRILGKTSLLDYIKDLEEEILTLEEKPIIIGHSMGGLLGQMLASKGLAEALILISPLPPRGILALSAHSLKTIFYLFTKSFFWRKPLKINPASDRRLDKFPVIERDEIYKKFVYESGKALFEIYFWALDYRRATNIKDGVLFCPILIVSGDEDVITSRGVIDSILHKYTPVASHFEFAGFGNWLFYEPDWQRPAQRIEEWIKSLNG